MNAVLLLIILSLLVVAWGTYERQLHRRNLARIPIRIHVNGTRGKSGVTRLIAAGLRAAGIRTCAKTTGTLARMILPDGTEQPVVRLSRPNVIEQVGVIKTAVAHRAEAIVLECMAVQPALQSLCELDLVQATHGVVTNARADHLDAMGPTAGDVALALAGTVPVGGKLFTAERKYLDVFDAAARDRGAELIPVGAAEVESVAEVELSGFTYIEHPENVAVALRVCEQLGIDRPTALRGMWAAEPDAGVMTTHRLDLFGREVVFVNGFAANDPESTEGNWNLALGRFPAMARRIAVFNCRHDRADRSIQLAEACVAWQTADHYLLIGSGTQVFIRRVLACGLDAERITVAEGESVEGIVERITDLAGQSALVMGMGNIGGPGLELVRYFAERSTADQPQLAKEAA